MNRKIETPATPTEAKKRSPAVTAATAYNRIQELRSACDREIVEAPASIERRYEAKVAAVRAGLDGDAAELLAKLLGEP